MARLIWSPSAAEDLASACDYIARDSEQYARLFAQRVIETLERTSENPGLGAMVPEYNDPNIRERIVQGYRVVYRVKKDAIQVVQIVHGARLLPPLPSQN